MNEEHMFSNIQVKIEPEEEPSVQGDGSIQNNIPEEVYIKQELEANHNEGECPIKEKEGQFTEEKHHMYNIYEDMEITIDPVKLECNTNELESFEENPKPSSLTKIDEEVVQTIQNDERLLKVRTPSKTYQRVKSCKKPAPPSWGEEKTKILEETKQKPEENMDLCAPEENSKSNLLEQSKLLPPQLSNKPSKKNVKIRRESDNRLHSCLFCKMQYSRLFTHFVSKHSDQMELEIIKDLPRINRLQHLVRFKRLGDFQNNLQALINKTDDLIVLKLSESFLGHCGSEKFVPCPDCTGFLHQSQLFKHYYKCIAKHTRHVSVTQRDLLKESRLLLRHALLTKVTNFKTAIKVGFNDFAIAAKHDKCLILLGEHMLIISNHSEDALVTVRKMMKRMGGLLLSCRSIALDSTLTMSDILLPDMVKMLIMSVKSILVTKTEYLQKIELGTDFFSKITICAFILRSKCLLENDLPNADNHLHFYHDFVETWEKEIGNNKIVNDDLPLASNLINLKETLESTIIKLTNEIKNTKKSISSLWHDLTESTLCLLCLFNAAVEFNAIENLNIFEYAVRPDWSVDDIEEYKDKLPIFTYHLAAKRFVISTSFYGKESILLLTKPIKKAIDVLISSRCRTSISPNNTFVFAAQSYSLSCFKSVKCFYNLCINTGYLNTDVMEDMQKRKYISFLTQISDMSPQEKTWAENYLKVNESTFGKDGFTFAIEDEVIQAFKEWKMHLKRKNQVLAKKSKIPTIH